MGMYGLVIYGLYEYDMWIISINPLFMEYGYISGMMMGFTMTLMMDSSWIVDDQFLLDSVAPN